MEDAETGEQLLVDTSDPIFRRRFGEVVAARERQLQADVRRAGIRLDAISTEEELVGALLRLAALRKRRRR